MIQSFLDSWALFGDTYLAGWLAAAALATVGVLVIARDQIFHGAAVAQASTLGVALALVTGAASTLTDRTAVTALAVLASVTASILPGRIRWETPEGVTGWLFLFSAAGTILLLAHDPHGLETVHGLLFSSLIGADRRDLILFLGLTILSLGFALAWRRRWVLLLLDPLMAAATGMRVRRWELAAAAWVGLVVGLGLRTAGFLYTFGCLVLPPLAARHLCRRAGSLFWGAPLVALLCVPPAFLLAHAGDYPPGQMSVALLAAACALTWIVARLRS